MEKYFERNHYYYGKLMTVRDFSLEQRYFNEKRWLMNRVVNGSGVVYGLDVEPKENDPETVIVTPGLAIDCYGREIWVNEEQEIQILASGTNQHNQICLQFKEIKTESTSLPPVVGEQEEKWEFNRIRESFEIFSKLGSPDDAEEPSLILAEVSKTPFTIDYAKRKIVHTNPGLLDLINSVHADLPRVTGINWQHGKEWDEFAGALWEKSAENLTVTFDREMAENTINTETFSLLVKQKAPDTKTWLYEYVPGEVEYHYEEETGNSTATFTIDSTWNSGVLSRMSQQENTLEFKVVLKGDFIMSAGHSGKPVKALDGNFIGGKLPSGNGVQGGDFVSWFRVIKPPEVQQKQQ